MYFSLYEQKSFIQQVFLLEFAANVFKVLNMTVSGEHLTSQCFQIPLTLRMSSVWDFVIRIFARKTLLNMGRVLSTISC